MVPSGRSKRSVADRGSPGSWSDTTITGLLAGDAAALELGLADPVELAALLLPQAASKRAAITGAIHARLWTILSVVRKRGPAPLVTNGAAAPSAPRGAGRRG